MFSIYILLILGTLLALPPMLWLVSTMPFLALLSLPALCCFLWATRLSLPRNKNNVKNVKYHVIITGGSQGTGLALALEAVRRSDVVRVSILARNPKKLQDAQNELERAAKEVDKLDVTIVQCSCDVTDPQALKDAAAELCPSNSSQSNTKLLLFCCAGQAQPARFVESTTQQLQQQLQLNYLGTMYTVHAFLPHILAAYPAGANIMMTSSMVGLLGIYGYTGYAPAKFGLRGFAESLHQELLYSTGGNVTIQVCYPPDIDTPGYAKENMTKPRECALVSETSDLYQPTQVAQRMLSEATQGHPKLFVYCNFDGFLLSTLASGFAPVTQLGDLVAQVCGMNLLKWVSVFYLQYFYHIFRQCQTERDTMDKQSTTSADEDKSD